MRVVYVAGPFTAGDGWAIEQNIRRAEEVGYRVVELGASPLIPHTNTRFFSGTKTAEFWYEATLELLRRCDAMVTVEGWQDSKGTKRELAEAAERGIPVFDINREDGLASFKRWLAS